MWAAAETGSTGWNILSSSHAFHLVFSHHVFRVLSVLFLPLTFITPVVPMICNLQHSWFKSWNNKDCFFIFHLSTLNVRNYATPPHLLVHEYVDERVDDGGELGQQRRHDARLRAQEVSGPEGGEQSRHSVRQPADQVAHHHGDDHHQHPLLSAAAHHRTHAAHLGEENNRKWRFLEFYTYAWWEEHNVVYGASMFLLRAIYHHLWNYSR